MKKTSVSLIGLLVAVAVPLMSCGNTSTDPVAQENSPAVSAPTFSPEGGAFASAQSVALTTATPDAVIHYTLDGSAPTATSPAYSGAIAVSATTTIQAIAVKAGMANSPVASAAYVISIPGTVAAPTFSPGAGTYASAQSVTLSTTTSGASIFYTTDGSTPTASSKAYSGAIAVSATTTLKAIAAKSGMATSPVASAVFTISTGGSTDPIPWNDAIPYGALTDSRDGKTYRTVTIGSQVWMAENLHFAGSDTVVGKCYENSADSCAKYGRLYTWAEVMAGAAPSSASPSGVQGLCPAGWHVPSDAEWTTLRFNPAPERAKTATQLKSTSGWVPNLYGPGNGTDTYGFRALPGGFIYAGTSVYAGQYANWWTTTEVNSQQVYDLTLYYDSDSPARSYITKTGYSYSLRCLQN